ncbi:MAG: hypothetical protein GY721_00710 [Deltaproteobacteria bacterium]|nr:hypothetical protein [Deltaproteobacteria bacterium]
MSSITKLKPASRVSYADAMTTFLRYVAREMGLNSSRISDATLVPPPGLSWQVFKTMKRDGYTASTIKHTDMSLRVVAKALGLPKQHWLSKQEQAKLKAMWTSMSSDDPPLHARLFPEQQLRLAILSSFEKASDAYKLLSMSKPKSCRQSYKERLCVQDARAHAMATMALAIAGRRSDIARLRISLFTARHLFVFAKAPGDVLSLQVFKGKTGTRSVEVPPSPYKAFCPVRAMVIWIRVAFWSRAYTRSVASSPTDQDLQSFSYVFRTTSTLSWGHRLTPAAAGAAMESWIDRLLSPHIPSGTLTAPSPVPTPSSSARKGFSSHSFRHTSLSLMARTATSDVLRVFSRDKHAVSLDPYLEQTAVPSVASHLAHPNILNANAVGTDQRSHTPP